ncbi:hypothetical protein S23_57750 [Bradyrhizobium cosmicum]|uniref:Uncharacterized protein n=1 Tax=Bradyrhizobium cosmicum TaxID=1404864 RepID=A0AAI8MIH1_9BRAD|nr:hypothetical protein S23_57750 [Bradyrhizobium cosmicum]
MCLSPSFVGSLSVTESVVGLPPVIRVHRMQLQYSHPFGPSLTPAQQTHCPDCGERLSRMRSSGLSAFDVGAFACAGCHPVHIAAGETDPIKSTAVLWLASHDLRPPA